MTAEIGLLTTALAFLASVYAIGAALYGARMRQPAFVHSARNGVILTFGLLSIAIASLIFALLGEQYQLSYVWEVSSPDMPLFFRITALWGSQAGSLLFWSWLMSGFTAGAVIFQWRGHERLMPYVIAYMMVTLAFFLGLSLFIENPFTRYWVIQGEITQSALIPAGGIAPSAGWLHDTAQGLNPLLRHFGMAIHPPMLYLGFVGFIVPYAFGMAALASGDLSISWIKAARRWTLAAWLFLSLGLLLGGRWAYDVLGWGGYWGWDPVENAAFLPWLMGTAMLHSVMIQEKRGMLKLWNMLLVALTFSAVIFGTFATRSGLVESVHSFARSGIGLPMFTFWFGLTLISVWLILLRREQGLLRDEHPLRHPFSREALFVLNNLIFVALFVAIFWGSFGAPIISELFLGTDITLGTDYFMRVTPPLFAALYLLMGVAPLAAWGTASFRRLGSAMLIPIGLTLLTVSGFALGGMAMPGALIAYGIVSLAGWVVVYETYRAARARMRAHQENPLAALLSVARRNPRRYGGYLIHLGVTIIGIGVIGSTLYQQETQQTLALGESLTLGGYELRYANLETGLVADDGRIMDIATIAIMRGGQQIATLRPRRDLFPNSEMGNMTIAGAHSTLENDVYVLLVGWDEINQQAATFKVYINPLINLIWWGGLVLIAGTLLAVYPAQALTVSARQRLQPAVQMGSWGALLPRAQKR